MNKISAKNLIEIWIFFKTRCRLHCLYRDKALVNFCVRYSEIPCVAAWLALEVIQPPKRVASGRPTARMPGGGPVRSSVRPLSRLSAARPSWPLSKLHAGRATLRTLVADKLHYNFNVTGGISTNCNLGTDPLWIEAKVENVTHITYEFKVYIRLRLIFPEVAKGWI